MAKILAVDDSLTIREMVRVILTEQGHEVILAKDGVEAMDIARQTPVDLVLTDINMPNMNGISLVSKLRRLEHYDSIPILMLTTETASYKKTKSKNMGANGWVQKPFQPESLMKAVATMLNE